MTVAKANSDIRWIKGGLEKPVFLWSPTSNLLALTYTDESGNHRAEVMDPGHNSTAIIPSQLNTRTTGVDENTAQGRKLILVAFGSYD